MNERMTRWLRPRSIGGAALIVLLALLGSGLLAGCSAGHAATWTAEPGGASTTTAPTDGGGPGMLAMMSTADAAALWSARPAFVRADGRVQEAYAFALEAGGALRYMPCYCGCAAMDHRSNLDCFLRRGSGAGAAAFEEHASYCDVCVQTALMTKRMLAAGSSLGEIRAAVDATFGGNGATGTPTELPPS
jgi:hypothetical protein